MVPWTQLREPIWESEDERTSEFTHFNLVIRLRKVKQSAIRFCAMFAILLYLPSLRYLGTFTFAQVKLYGTYGTAWNRFFLSQTGTLPALHMFPARLQVHGFSLQVWSTLVFGEVEHIVHLIHLNLNSRLMPTCGFDRLPSLRGNNARPYFKELNHKWFWNFYLFLVHRLQFIMWPWNSPTSWPRPPPSSRSASPPLTSSPWTTQHVSSHHCPPLLGQPPMTMPPTPTTPLSQSPPEHVFGHPTDRHLHWTSRQSTPTFPPQPPFPSQPSPLHSHMTTPQTTSTAPQAWTLDPCEQQSTVNGTFFYTPRTPSWPSSSSIEFIRTSSTRSTSTYDITDASYLYIPTLTTRHSTPYRHITSSISTTIDQEIHITLWRSPPTPMWLADGPISIQDPEDSDAGQHREDLSTACTSRTSSSTWTMTWPTPHNDAQPLRTSKTPIQVSSQSTSSSTTRGWTLPSTSSKTITSCHISTFQSTSPTISTSLPDQIPITRCSTTTRPQPVRSPLPRHRSAPHHPKARRTPSPERCRSPRRDRTRRHRDRDEHGPMKLRSRSRQRHPIALRPRQPGKYSSALSPDARQPHQDQADHVSAKSASRRPNRILPGNPTPDGPGSDYSPRCKPLATSLPGSRTSSLCTSTWYDTCSTPTTTLQHLLWSTRLSDPGPHRHLTSLLGQIRFSTFSRWSFFITDYTAYHFLFQISILGFFSTYLTCSPPSTNDFGKPTFNF